MKRSSYQSGSVTRKPRKLGPDVWVFRYMDSGKQRAEILGTVDELRTESAARKKALKRLGEINEERSCVRVSGLCERFKREELDVRPKTRGTYLGFLKRVKRDLGTLRLDELTPILMENWVNNLMTIAVESTEKRNARPSHPMSKKTKLHYKGFLHLLLEFAMKHQVYRIQRNPVGLLKVKGKASPVRVHTLLTGDQYRKLIADPDLPEHCRVMIQVAMILGVRVSEVLGLKWDALDFKKSTVAIRISVVGKNADDTKTLASQDELPMHDDLAAVLEEWMKGFTQNGQVVTEWLFENVATGKPFWGGNLQRDYLVPAGKKVGIKALGWHDFRHTYRAMMGEIGVPPELQMKLMRHSDITMSMKYGAKSNVEQTRLENAKVVEFLRRKA